MAKDKNKKDQEVPEVVGLEEEEVEEQPTPKAFPFKKLLIPVMIAVVSFVIAVGAAMFLGQSAADYSSEETAELTESNKTKVVELLAGKRPGPKVKSTLNEDGIDTADIMADLEFLNYVPEMEAAEKGLDAGESKGSGQELINPADMTPQDSVDTLNWLAKEMSKLAKAKAADQKRKKELEVMKYKIDQALARINQAESSRIIELARLYDAMKAEEVAKLFENLDDEAVMSILPRMKSANAAKILALMPPKRAAGISTKMITVLDE